MNCSQRGLDLIKRYEGFSAMPYLCPAGYWTIGYGHLVRDKAAWHAGIDAAAAERLLREDVGMAERAVCRLIGVPLRQTQFDALVSFTFNLGSGALQRSTLRRAVNRADHEAAVAEFARWVFAGGKRLSGLVARRKAEALLYAHYQ